MGKTTIASASDSNDNWRAEDDMRTLARAEEVKNDPKRYKAALAMTKEKMAELQALADSAEPAAKK